MPHPLQLPQAETLRGEIRKTLQLLDKLDRFYREFQRHDLPKLGRGPSAAIVVAEILENVYTCAETLFMRISQAFENHLPPDRWHRELLARMTLRIDGLRENVLEDDTLACLLELMKFRHFRRYYFEFDYDWDRLDFLLKKYGALHSLLPRDLERFDQFLAATIQVVAAPP
ncbi:MAG: hypothetical protein WC708_15595, partial [Lentisphaeria bacterium]